MSEAELPRLVSRLRVDWLLRQVAAQGGFGAVLARGDAEAGAIAVVARSGGNEELLAPVLGAAGYEMAVMASGDAVPGWIERARRRDPDLWVIELDIPQAAQLVAQILSPG
ncbi:hypothetical protein CAP39_01480 [Sphingomonas sp. IBVSS1]|nr:hypothetical protein CAP39_01480 [Sphingomonas sp. IBVSS1]